jgi:BirA family biotin operon repressor/biotin-[acetyl-CoA-carboxylase] ligase
MQLQLETLRTLTKAPATLPIYLFTTLDSTNNFLLNKIPQGQAAFCLAEEQTQGRGQHGKTWISPPGQNIYLSYLYYCREPLHQLQDISIKTGEVLRRYLTEELSLPALTLKWPNDLLYEQKKLAGILVETQTYQDLSALVIGIGLNVNMQTTPQAINQAWTSLAKITKKNYDLNMIAGGLMNNLLKVFPP